MKPADVNDFNIVLDIERAALSLVGPFTEKERKSMVDLFEKASRLNHPWLEMGIEYGDHIKPSKPQRQMKAAGNVGSENTGAPPR